MYGSRKILQASSTGAYNPIDTVITGSGIVANAQPLSSFNISVCSIYGQTGDLIIVAAAFATNSPQTISFSGSIEGTNLMLSRTSGLGGTAGVVIYSFRLTADNPTVLMSAGSGGDGSGSMNIFNYHLLRGGPPLRGDDSFGSQVSAFANNSNEPNPDGDSMADPAFGTVVGYYTCATMYDKQYSSVNISAPTGFTNLRVVGESYSSYQMTQASSVMLPDAANYAEPLLSGAYGINDTLQHSYWNFYGVPIILN